MFANEEGYWIYLNSDGAMKLDSEMTAFGGVLRDRHGGWILGFNKSLGHYLVFNAKVWGVLDGLMIIQSRNYDVVVIRSDSQEALKAIDDSFSKNSSSVLVKRIQQLLMNIGRWKFEHIPREEYVEADRIAKLAFDKNERLRLVEDIPLDWIKLM
ncbi:hypothetical protein Goklo_012089 [Gossypium klotzschianum]|uniref:RNase H type-1 domain-containing protein n=1 Tax=Gossypium klotzschianum TaxID=34286 RepID=A0A7J8VBH7_9ROSI|nr:hypothetical protein [Gossypium klotzschianum]